MICIVHYLTNDLETNICIWFIFQIEVFYHKKWQVNHGRIQEEENSILYCNKTKFYCKFCRNILYVNKKNLWPLSFLFRKNHNSSVFNISIKLLCVEKGIDVNISLPYPPSLSFFPFCAKYQKKRESFIFYAFSQKNIHLQYIC